MERAFQLVQEAENELLGQADETEVRHIHVVPKKDLKFFVMMQEFLRFPMKKWRSMWP